MPIRHAVLFGFKPSATPEQVRGVEEAFAALPAKIPLIREYEWGTDESPEGLAGGHTHLFFLTFEGRAERDAYLVHPEHVRFVKEVLEPVLAKATVLDYVPRT